LPAPPQAPADTLRFFTTHLLANTNLALSELIGSPAQSPLVERRSQLTFSMSVAYRW
jgi:outer membrane scaffolding protein for murein synthesis (MipA/OmpV family)